MAAGRADVQNPALALREGVIGHRNDALLLVYDLVGPVGHVLAQVAGDQFVVAGIGEVVVGKNGQFDQGLSVIEGQDVEKARFAQLRNAKVHQHCRVGVEGGLGGAHHPALEMLIEIVAGFPVDRTEEDAVEHPVGLEAAAIGQLYLPLLPGIDQAFDLPVAQLHIGRRFDLRAHRAVKIDTPDHFVLIGANVESPPELRPIEMEPVPTLVHQMFEGPRAGFPKAPGAVVGALLLAVDQQDPLFPPGRMKQVMNQAQAGQSTAGNDDIVGIRHGGRVTRETGCWLLVGLSNNQHHLIFPRYSRSLLAAV